MDNRILIVEDDQDLLEALRITLKNAGFNVETALSAELALEMIKIKKFNIMVSDVNLGKMNGIELLQNVKKNFQEMAVILMTAYGKVADAVSAIQNGAVDYITKPFNANDLIHKVNAITKSSSITQDNIIHEDNQTKKIVDLATQVAQSDASVLISGESGTGKEIFAQYIHNTSKRKAHPFVAINCAAIPENMLESILFGYEKGAFTGAYQSTMGKLEQGNNGTILLDEISEMPLFLQAKLLRVLQEREVERLGAKKMTKLDVRIIATTNRKLAQEVAEGTFRKDLYFRLNVFPLHIPPLRSRLDDIIPLSTYFIQKYTHDNPKFSLSMDAKKKLVSYSWPGNIRELQNVIQRAIILSKNNLIEAADLSFEEKEQVFESSDNENNNDLADQLIDKENDLILKVLQKHAGNRNASADELGISPRTLRYKLSRMKKMGIIFS
ncbi:MAG: sigma-54-dependent Fis family transcriptional regulator [Gammaproteobacteria bacterium]|nr:sigma-54-dependent Fis family transcriptional regulator [Gammaproteobacteria bacterium]